MTTQWPRMPTHDYTWPDFTGMTMHDLTSQVSTWLGERNIIPFTTRCCSVKIRVDLKTHGVTVDTYLHCWIQLHAAKAARQTCLSVCLSAILQQIRPTPGCDSVINFLSSPEGEIVCFQLFLCGAIVVRGCPPCWNGAVLDHHKVRSW